MQHKISNPSILDRVVCELPRGKYVAGFKWYELQISSLEETCLPNPEIPFSPDIRFIAASHTRSAYKSLEHISLALSKQFKYILFESISNTHTSDALKIIQAAGATSIAACHMHERDLSPNAILNQLQVMADLGAHIVKVAYPAYSPTEIASGFIALDRAAAEIKVPVSITPMGTAWGRIAAGLAGSYLMFAPLCATADRHSAKDVVRLLQKMQNNFHSSSESDVFKHEASK